jgi:hypothetical protein
MREEVAEDLIPSFLVTTQNTERAPPLVLEKRGWWEGPRKLRRTCFKVVQLTIDNSPITGGTVTASIPNVPSTAQPGSLDITSDPQIKCIRQDRGIYLIANIMQRRRDVPPYMSPSVSKSGHLDRCVSHREVGLMLV